MKLFRRKKNFYIRTLSLFLCLLLGIFPAFTAFAESADTPAESAADSGAAEAESTEEAEETEETGDTVIKYADIASLSSEDLSGRFGENVTLTEGEDGSLLVNGYPAREVIGSFDNLQMNSFYSFYTEFLDYPFYQPSTSYDGNLALMSLTMALSASRDNFITDGSSDEYDPSEGEAGSTDEGESYYDEESYYSGFSFLDYRDVSLDSEPESIGSLYLDQFYKDAGFSDIRRDDYAKIPTMYTVSTSIGSREMVSEDGEPFTLIAVGICGEGYGNEWLSNITPGDGPIHQGFMNAATLVVDRLSGYITTRGITGRIKVWLNGFSRAGAVANVTAGILNDTDTFAKEDIYAYTFATPSAVKNPPETGYENIFNIINPMDQIPQVMPSEWGYGRFGQNLYLPVTEFSSEDGFISEYFREIGYSNSVDVNLTYNPGLNLRMRILYSLLLDIMESPDYYNMTFQPTMAWLMANSSMPNTLIALRALMLNLQETSHPEHININEFMDYTLRLLDYIIKSSGENTRNANKNPVVQLFTEHTQSAYLANSINLANGTFEENDQFFYVMVKGPVTITLRSHEFDSEFYMSSKGIIWNQETEDDPVLPEENAIIPYYLERIGDVSIAAIPADEDCEVIWEAEQDSDVECILIDMRVNAAGEFNRYTREPVRALSGESEIVYSGCRDRTPLPEGYNYDVIDGRTFAEFLGIASLKIASYEINWRIFIMIAAFLAGFLICVIFCLFYYRKSFRRKRDPLGIRLLICLFGAAVLETEAAFWLFADMISLQILWEAAASFCLLVICLWKKHRAKVSLWYSCLPLLLIVLAADLTMGYQDTAGIILYLLFHLAVAIRFIKERPMPVSRWILWVLFSVGGDACIILTCRANPNVQDEWQFAAWCVPLLLLMLFSSIRQKPALRLCGILFFLSDLLLAVCVYFLLNPVLHTAYTLLFGTAALILSLSVFRKPRKENETAA